MCDYNFAAVNAANRYPLKMPTFTDKKRMGGERSMVKGKGGGWGVLSCT